MKTNTIIIITVIVLLLGVGGFYGHKYYKKYQDSSLLGFETGTIEIPVFQINNISEIPGKVIDILDGWTTIKAGIILKNYSKSKYTINQIHVSLYTKEDTLFAEPLSMLETDLVIKPNGKTEVQFEYEVGTAGIKELIKNYKGVNYLLKMTNALTNYYNKNELGIEVVAKGYVVAENIPFNIPINETFII